MLGIAFDQGLFLTTSDVDNSGKSYYGETNLYLVGLNGQFECKVALGESESQVDAVCIWCLRG